jgi:hypothetical protein
VTIATDLRAVIASGDHFASPPQTPAAMPETSRRIASQFRPATRWQTPAPWRSAPATVSEIGMRHGAPELEGKRQAPPLLCATTAVAMLADLRLSIRRGHWKVAIRRFLMMRARAFDVPAHETRQCSALIAKCPAIDLARMEMAAAEWVRLVTGFAAARLDTPPAPAL